MGLAPIALSVMSLAVWGKSAQNLSIWGGKTVTGGYIIMH